MFSARPKIIEPRTAPGTEDKPPITAPVKPLIVNETPICGKIFCSSPIIIPATSTFLEDYETKFGKESPWEVISANAYDGMNLVAMAIEEAGYDADGIRDYLYAVENYNGVAGELTINDDGDALKGFHLMEIKDGEFIKLE